MKTLIKLETAYKPSQGPHVFSKVPFVTFEAANLESIGKIHRVSNLVFSVSSYILVLRLAFRKLYVDFKELFKVEIAAKAPEITHYKLQFTWFTFLKVNVIISKRLNKWSQ